MNELDELVLHAAIYASPSKRATELASYLVKTQPSLLEVRAANGVTPLMLACRFGRLDIAKILIDAGADQTTKDQGRNNLLHAALYSTPGAKKLKPLLDLLDRKALIPMLKERNKLEHEGRTPIHQYFNATATYRNQAANTVIEVFKLLVDISPETVKEALRMLDGVGDAPLHLLLARDADPALVRTITDFDQSLLFCENAVGRTPAEIAHDRYLVDVVKMPPFSSWRQDDSVSTLVSALPSTFAKSKSCDEPKEHEPKEHEARSIVAQNWRLCADILARSGQVKRTLVSLLSASFVAQRLGQKHAKDRYRCQLVKKTEDNAGASDGCQSGDNEKSNGTTAVAEPNPKPRRVDVISSIYHHHNHAWEKPKKEKNEGAGTEAGDGEDSSEENDSDDEVPPGVCRGCRERHV